MIFVTIIQFLRFENKEFCNNRYDLVLEALFSCIEIKNILFLAVLCYSGQAVLNEVAEIQAVFGQIMWYHAFSWQKQYTEEQKRGVLESSIPRFLGYISEAF